MHVVPTDADLVLPISTTRFLACHRGRVTMRESNRERWQSDKLVGASRKVVDGAVLLDATFVALVSQSTEGTLHVVVFGVREPIVQHRFTLGGATAVRFARKRGHAIALIERRRLVVLDLRFGSVIAEHALPEDALDVEIDDSGQQVAIAYADGIRTSSLRELATSQTSSLRPEPEAPPPVTAPVRRLELTTPLARDIPLASAVALAPRIPLSCTTLDETVALLDAYRDVVASLLERAIAISWDERRLAGAQPDALPFRDEVHGIRRRRRGSAGAELDQATRGVVAAMHTLSATEATLADRMSPLRRLTHELGLSATAIQILLLAAAPVLWGEQARLYAILCNDVARPLCDEELIASVLGPQVTAREIARELEPDAPLVRHGVVRVGPGMRPFAALSIEPAVIRILRGAETSDTHIRAADVAFEDLCIPIATKHKIASAMALAPLGSPRIVVRGRTGSGRHTLLAALAEASGRELGIIDARPILRDLAARAHELRQALHRAHLQGLLPCIDGLEAVPSDDPEARERVRDILRDHPGPLAIRLPRDAQAPLDPSFVSLDLPPLTITDRLAAWTSALAATGLSVRDPLELATRYNSAPGTIVRACRAVAHAGTPDGDASAAVESALRQLIESRLGAAATKVERLATWSQVILPPDIQDSITELIARFKHRRTVFETWNFDRIVTTARGVTALFSGGPGTGKTLVAGAIATDLGVDVYRVDLSRIMSKWIGETEQNLAKLFDAAEEANAIILFDEADSLFAKRTKVQSSNDRYANLEVNYLLQRLDTFEGVAILTTNFGTAIDRAFARRLTVRVTFPFPDDETREELWRAHLPTEMPTTGALDLADLARRFKLSGGYIRNAALRAAFLAAEEQSPLSQDHLERAIRAEFRENNQICESSELA